MADDRRYHHGNLGPALVQAGLDILREQGLEKLSLRACAERVGVSHMAPKNHFGNVTGLLSAISAEGFIALKAEMERGLSEHASRTECRDAAFRGYVAFAKANPALFELMFTRRLVNFSDPALKGPMSDCAAILRHLSAGMIWDKADLPDADLRAQMLNWCIVHGFAQLAVQGVFDKDGMRHLGIEDITPDVAYRD